MMRETSGSNNMDNEKPYLLNLDGPLFRAQRKLLLRIADAARQKRPYEPAHGDGELLEGLLGLTDAVADQGHDRHGIDCLLDGSPD
jgi:hypothetical protein